MQTTVRSLLLASAVVAAAAFTAQTAAAETLRVPFDFTVNGKTMPAGRYSVQRDSLRDFVTLEGPKNKFTWMLVPGDAAPSSNQVMLSFTRNGAQYALHAIQYRALTTCVLDKSKSNHVASHVVRGD
jgi:hypothetical protein